jgi:hypothetical protein
MPATMRDPIRLVRPSLEDGGKPALGKGAVPYPLDVVYAQAGIAPPAAARIAPRDIPLPYRSLLVHERDMTLTFSKGRWYFRRVLLVQEYSGRPVEMGAIRIDLDAFTTRIRAQILRNQVPLGRLLRDGGVDYRSRPRAFLGFRPNSEMMGVFWMREPRTLFGRQTEVVLDRKKIGDIVEILPLV